eukprot:CAMPEP_0170410956 /NCGR_PEP_ID=MMETSP0117_2-20130122/30167_1 /TAXON_ID=400756 /ORGANISM="Durinskia baltica, Strain CSIRO CS-38" /LENGTH=330 /DNA_ID=CAMNT_0010668525 /DNA_START=63 /DNA_END=1052 /DNA_ORIENTATION=+
MSNSNSASHWCKTVIDQAVPAQSISLVPPPAPVFNPSASAQVAPKGKPTIQTTALASSASSNFDARLSPQYVQLYNQIYTQPQSATTPSDSNRSYASVVAQQSNPGGLSRPISAPWGTYGAAIVPPPPMPVPSPASIAAAVQHKKPNPSRFTAVAPPVGLGVGSGPPGLSATRSAPAAAATTTTGQHAPPTSGQPESLKRFVKNAFSSCNTNEQREFITEALKNLIAQVTAAGRMQVHDWDHEQMPVFDPSKTNKSASATSRFGPISSTTNQPGLSNASMSISSYNPYLSVDANNKSDKKRKGRFVETEDNGNISFSDISAGSGKSSVLA